MLHDLDTFAAHLIAHGIGPKSPPYVGIPGNSPAIAFPSRLLRGCLADMEVTGVSVSSVDYRTGNGPLYSVEVHGHTAGNPRCKRRYVVHAVAPDYQSRRNMMKEQSAWAERQRASRCRAAGWTRATVERETEADGFTGARKVLRKAGLTIDGASVRHEASGLEVLACRNEREAVVLAERILRQYPAIDWTLPQDDLMASIGEDVKKALGQLQRETR